MSSNSVLSDLDGDGLAELEAESRSFVASGQVPSAKVRRKGTFKNDANLCKCNESSNEEYSSGNIPKKATEAVQDFIIERVNHSTSANKRIPQKQPTTGFPMPSKLKASIPIPHRQRNGQGICDGKATAEGKQAEEKIPTTEEEHDAFPLFSDIIRGTSSPLFTERQHSVRLLKRSIESRMIGEAGYEWIPSVVANLVDRTDAATTSFLRLLFPPSADSIWTTVFWPPDLAQLQACMEWSRAPTVLQMPQSKDAKGRMLVADKTSVKPVSDFSSRKRIAHLVAERWQGDEPEIWKEVLKVPSVLSVGKAVWHTGAWRRLCQLRKPDSVPAVFVGMGLHGLRGLAGLPSLLETYDTSATALLGVLALYATRQEQIFRYIDVQQIEDLVMDVEGADVIQLCFRNRIIEGLLSHDVRWAPLAALASNVIDEGLGLLQTESDDIRWSYLASSSMNLLRAGVPHLLVLEEKALPLWSRISEGLRRKCKDLNATKEPSICEDHDYAPNAFESYGQATADSDRQRYVRRVWALAYAVSSARDFFDTFSKLLPAPNAFYAEDIPWQFTDWIQHVSSLVQ